MTLEYIKHLYRKEKKLEAGLCIQGGCFEKPVKTQRCELHRKKHNAYTLAGWARRKAARLSDQEAKP